MLQNPAKDVLAPLVPSDAHTFETVDVTVVADGDRLSCRFADLEISIPVSPNAVCTCSDDAYINGYDAAMAGDAEQAASCFTSAALKNGPTAPSLYGLATALCSLEEFETASEITSFLAAIKPFADPRPAALAGYTAFRLTRAKEARVHLALAARIARTKAEFRPIQRFCQTVLLTQQFGT